ncbi:MAG: tetratricopeptide repeat protein [Nannocystaceae bacterium]|nr:tetratricopeptide repeat protein [Nannocystaceae bacterium]
MRGDSGGTSDQGSAGADRDDASAVVEAASLVVDPRDRYDETAIGGEEVERLAEPHPAGSKLGRYVILERVGQGGMGVVYAAFDPELNRRVALKILHATRSSGTGHQGPPRLRLLREAQAIAQVSHPNVIHVYDAGTVEGAVFVAMEFVEGPTLTAWQGQKRPLRELLTMYARAGRGLAAAHDAGIVHRDFKPDNVLIGPDGHPRVLDFGLARAESSSSAVGRSAHAQPRGLERAGADESGPGTDVLTSPLTQDGAVVGTPRFMAPEQHAGVAADARSDQFSFCVALYQALFRQDPFAAPTLERLALAKQAGQLQRIPDVGVPTRVCDAIVRGLAADPAARWPDMHRLVAVLEYDHVAARRRRVFGGVLAVAVAGAVVSAVQLARAPGHACDDDPALDAMLSPARIDAIAARFGALGVPWAEREWDATARTLQAYAASYQASFRGACEATVEQGTQSHAVLDRRMQCLGGRRRALAALLDVLDTADLAAAERASAAAVGLPPVSACDNLDYVLASVAPPDAALASDVAAARDSLAQAGALLAAGRARPARTVVEEVDATARRLGYEPLRAEVLLRRAVVDEALGAWDPAEQGLHDALDLALAIGHDEVAAAAALSLTGVVGDRLSRHAEGLRWAAVARALQRRLSLDAASTARLQASEGNVLYRMDRLDEAQLAYEGAIATIEAEGGAADPRLVGWLSNLGNVHYRAHRREQARAVFERAAALAEATHGHEHPMCATVDFSLANVLSDLQQWDEAERRLLDAQRRLTTALGADHPFVVAALCNLGVIDEGRGDLARAIDRFDQCRQRIVATQGSESAEHARALHNLGRVLREHGELDRARAQLERALQLRSTLLGAAHSDTVATEVDLAELDLAAGASDAACTRAQSVIDAGPSDPLELARARWVLARGLWAQHGPDARAHELARAAHQAYADDGVASARVTDEIAQWLATHARPTGPSAPAAGAVHPHEKK